MHSFKRKTGRRIAAICLALANALSLGAAPVFAADEAEQPNEPGLWITEMYVDDVDAYVDCFINYPFCGEQLEFVEITNTSSDNISLKDYTLYYEENNGEPVQLEISAATDDDDMFVPAGESVVIWNQRSDLGGTEGTDYASEEQFREYLMVDEDVAVYTTNYAGGFANDDCGFMLKSGDDTRSQYHLIKNSTDVEKGDAPRLSQHLKVPDYGSEMSMWQESKLPSPGHAYDEQLSGQRTTPIPGEQPSGVYITEIYANDDEWPADKQAELYSYFEIMNTGSEAVDLNGEYDFVYVQRHSAQRMQLTIRQYDEANGRGSGQLNSSDDCVLGPGEVAVVWAYPTGYSGEYDAEQGKGETFPTEADFRAARNISDDVTVFITAENGDLSDRKGGLEIYTEPTGDETRGELVCRYLWNGGQGNDIDLKEGKSVDLKISHEGPLMAVKQMKATPSPGTVSEDQYTFPQGSGDPPTVSLSDSEFDEVWLDALDNGITQGEPLNVPYYYGEGDDTPVNRVELYYKTDKMSSYEMITTTNMRIYNKWYALISNGYLLDAEYVDYYAKFYNAYANTTTDTERVYIHDENDGVSGLRLSLNNADPSDEAYSGIVQVSAKDFSAGGDVALTIDGQPVEAAPSLERYAWLVFDATGLSTNFKNGITHGEQDSGGEVITTFAQSRLIPENGRVAFEIGQQYFTRNSDGSLTVNLTIRPGTFGTPWEGDTSWNNDDFTVQNMFLQLVDGTVIRPTECTGVLYDGDGNGEGAPVPLNYTDITKVGDVSGRYIRVDLEFTVPADKADAFAYELDTTSLDDGEHTITAASGDDTVSVTFTVDNSEPVEEPEPEPEFSLNMTLGEAGVVTDASVSTPEGAATVEIYEAAAVDGITVSEGSGDSTSAAASKADTAAATVSSDGQYPYQILSIPADGSEQFLRIEMTAEANYGKPVRLYVLSAESGEWLPLGTDTDGSKITALCPVAGNVSDGTVKVLVQARDGAFAPYTEPDTFTSVAGGNTGWDGRVKEGDTLADKIGAPDSYDFAFAWYSDTQYYSEEYQNHYANIVNWIVENKDELDIQYVLHTGDIVDEPDEEYEWAYASEQQQVLDDAGVPYGILGGNHDTAFGNMDYDMFWKYFGADRYEDNTWYGGSYKNNLGHYDIIEKDGVEILMLYISWDVYEEEAEWLNSVLAKYPDTPAIIATHCGINADGEQSYTSQYLLDNVCAENENVIAVFGGHFHGSSINKATYENADGTTRTVYEICTDYQSGSEGGSGYIKMLYFDLANGKIYINTYSPSKDDVNYYDGNFYDDPADSVPMSSVDRVILPLDIERSTGKSLTVSDLSVSSIGSELLGSEAAADASTSVRLTYMSGGDQVAAIAKDASGAVIGASAPAAFVGDTYERPDQSDESAEPGIRPDPDTDTDTDDGSDRPSTSTDMPFDDVDTGDWYYEAVEYVYENNLMNGVDSGSFEPDATLTRGMMVTLLWRLEGSPVPGSEVAFDDVSDGQWYADAVGWAVSEGIVNGVSGTEYAPNANITREQLATMLCRYAEYKGCDVSGSADLSAYADSAGISSYAASPLAWAVSSGLVNGVGDNSLLPQGSATRAQAATILMRFIENIMA